MVNAAVILVVDDSAFARRLFRDTIVSLASDLNKNFKFIEASNGNEAIEMYKRYSPCLVFMDIIMPEKDGLISLKEIREFDPNAKVIMCSSMGQKAYVNEAINHGMVDFIIKPYNDKHGMILQILKRYL